MEFESPYDPTILLNKQNPYHYTFRRGLIESLYNGTDVYVSEGDLSIAQVGSMSSIGDAIQEKCMNFADKVIKLNDYLLEQESKKEDDRSKKTKSGRIPVSLKSVANLSNQLLRAGTSVGANNAEATSAISRADYKSKSYIALKEARESLYWIELLHRNKYIDDRQYESLHEDSEELVKIFVSRCKKLDENNDPK